MSIDYTAIDRASLVRPDETSEIKIGGLIRLAPFLQAYTSAPYKLLWDDPPPNVDKTKTWWLKASIAKFFFTDVGLVLMQRDLPTDDPITVIAPYVKIMCSTGTGWIMKAYVENIA